MFILDYLLDNYCAVKFASSCPFPLIKAMGPVSKKKLWAIFGGPHQPSRTSPSVMPSYNQDYHMAPFLILLPLLLPLTVLHHLLFTFSFSKHVVIKFINE
jgi:hypothetical protein